MIDTCNKNNNNKIISTQASGREFIIKNNQSLNINKVEVDNCYITDGLRCDYLFEIIKNKTVVKVFYLELKGSDINHAIKQLETTIKHCQNIHFDAIKECHIVASKYKAPSSGQKSQKTRSEFKRKNKIQLFIKSKIKEVTV